MGTNAFLRVSKHGMQCNNENRFGTFFYLSYRGAFDYNEAHLCVMFNNTGVLYLVRVTFIIKYGGAFEH
jgi:hypothetical protein